VIALNSSNVYIWYRNTTLLDHDEVASADQHLSSEERARCDRFRFVADRRDFTVGHDLLRRTLSRHIDKPPADWRFSTDHYGKPSIESDDPFVRRLSFSLSGTRGSVACAITSNAPVGIDVERTDRSPHVQEIADRYFSENEAAWLRQCSDDQRVIRFVELWTLKEAFLKAIGVGLSGLPSCVSFQLDEHARIGFSGPSIINPQEWCFALFEPASNVRLGIAIRSVVQNRFLMCRNEDDGCVLDPIRVSAE